MYETYFDKIQREFAEKKREVHYMDTDSFVLSINTNNIMEDLKNLYCFFRFQLSKKNQELFSKRNQKVLEEIKIDTPTNTWMYEFSCLRSKANTFKCSDEKTNKLKNFSRSKAKNNKFDE